MQQTTLSGCVTGDLAGLGLALGSIHPDQLFPLFDVVTPLDAPEWINTGRTTHIDFGCFGFQAQHQILREFASWK